MGTSTDSNTGGGCIVNSPFSTLAADAPTGKDCSAIPNVADVLCQSGECVVNACKTGFQLSPAGDACVAATKRGLLDLEAVEGASLNLGGIGIQEEVAPGVHADRRGFLDLALE